MSDPTRIAFLSYYFPPIGGGGTPRSVKFVKYLGDHGYRPVVVTVAPDDRSYSREFQHDEGQIEELKDTCFDLIRVPNPARFGIQAAVWQSRWFPWIWAGAYPWFYDDARPWAYATGNELLLEAKQRAFSLIYATAGPNSTLIAASRAARKLGLPWVADLRDLWTVDSLKTYPARMHYLWLSQLERRTLRSAAAVIANTPIAGQRMKAWLGADGSERVHVISNGFDPAEFEEQTWRHTARRGRITLVHAGTLYDPTREVSRRGRYRPYNLDNSARSVKPIVDGLRALHTLAPETAARFHVRLLGHTPDKSHAYIAESGLANQFTCEGVRPRKEAISAMRDASALLVVQVAFVDSNKPVPYIPGKVYDYLPTGAPILAPVPQGDLRNLLSEVPQAYLSDYRYAGQVAESMRTLAADLDAGAVRGCDPKWLSRYSRVELTAELASVFDRVLGGRGQARAGGGSTVLSLSPSGP